MDDSGRPFNRSIDPLGVNKLGKNIKKNPINFNNNMNMNINSNSNSASAARQQPQPQPQVYNINKNDFRSIVQQLTGSPSHEQQPPPRPRPRPQNNPSKPPSMRLQKIRPPPLTPINRPRIPIHQIPAPVPPHYGQPSPPMLPPTPGDVWTNTAESPISVYMRYLQNSIIDSGPNQAQFQGPAHVRAHPPSSGLLPNPSLPNGLPSPRMNGPPLHSPGINGPPPLPSPTSQYLLPSPTGFFNLLSPRSPYPLLSPSMQHPPPLTPNFSFSPMAQPGILGPGPQYLPSPGYGFPMSPSGFFPILSPRWRGQ